MIRNWFNTKHFARNSSSHKSRQDVIGAEFGQFERLEDKRCLAFVGFFNGVTLELVQTFDDGDVVVDNSGPAGQFRVNDNSGTRTFVDATNVSVEMLSDTANQLNFNINGSHSGDVTLILNDGPRDVVFAGNGFPGIANFIPGDLLVTAGDDEQNINLAPQTLIPIPFETGGNATFELGDDFDLVYNNENFVRIGGDLTMVGVNLFRYTDFLFPVPLDADLMVGGNLTMDTSNESTESFLLEGGTFHDDDPDDPERSIIFGDFIYIGGDDIDHVNLNETYIVGNANIDLGEGIPFFGDPQNVTTTLVLPRIFGGPYFELDGDLTVKAGSSNLGNNITLDGYHDGQMATFEMGGLTDTIVYTLNGTQVDIMATMGAGDDMFTINRPVNRLIIDFGNDSGDNFLSNLSPVTFDVSLLNYHFFDMVYLVGSDRLTIDQLTNTGDVIIDNDGGTGTDWQLTTMGNTYSVLSSSNLVFNMLDNTGNNLELDLINPVIASIELNLGDGDREILFTGNSNNPLRDIDITADLGEQNVNISVNAPLAVASLRVDLGMGFDTLEDDANNLLLSEDFVLIGVNRFENDGILSVTRNVFVDTSGETEDSIFATNSSMFVGGTVTYAGGDGRDEVRLNGTDSTSLSNRVSIDLGDNVIGGTQYALLDNGTFIGGDLTVDSVGGTSPDVFRTDAATTYNGDVAIDLGDGDNTAVMRGNFLGTSTMYRGGTGVDIVTLGMTGNPLNFEGFLSQGDDIFNLEAGASVAPGPMFIDFGGNNDVFNSTYGPFDFNAEFRGLGGFDHFYNATSGKMTSNQVVDLGNVTIDNNGPAAAIRFTTLGTSTLTPVTSLEVNMLDNSTSALELQFDSSLDGDLTIDLGDGDRSLDFTGTANVINGVLDISAGLGDQVVELGVNSAFIVNGDATINLGLGDDIVDEDGNNVAVAGNLNLFGVNTFETEGITGVTGNLSVDNMGQGDPSTLANFGTLSVGGEFSYLGSGARDTVVLNSAGGTTISGNVTVDLGANVNGGAQTVLLNSATTSIGGLTVTSNNSTTTDTVLTAAGTVLGGDISIDLGDGNNEAILIGVFGGSSINYTGGADVDEVTIGTTGIPAAIDVSLGGNDDTLTLLGGTSVASLDVNFGGGDDTFVNNYGAFDFSANLDNYNGFDHFYNFPLDTLFSTQVSDSGAPITFDNNGTGNAIRVLAGGTSEVTPVTNLDITLLDGAASQIDIDFDVPHAGSLTVDMGDGARILNMFGNDNTLGGGMVISGGTGSQVVNLGANNPLVTGASVNINLGTGKDFLEQNGQNVTVGGNLTLTGVNSFINDKVVTIDGSFIVDSVGDLQVTKIENKTTMTIAGDFDYMGGDGRDRILFRGTNTSIGGLASINIGGNILGGSQLVSLDSAGTSIGGSLTVIATGEIGTDTFESNDGTTIGGDIDIHLGDGNNNAFIRGVIGGSLVKYNGGSGVDNVLVATTGNDADINVKLKAGNDRFTLGAGTAVANDELRVDFGGGNDNMVNEYGQFDFTTKLLNLNGFSRFYDTASNEMRIVQVEDTGDITIDNGGPGNGFRTLHENGIINELSAADSVRLQLMDNTSTNVVIDFDNAVAGNAILQLRNGTRDLTFIGTNNSVGGLLRVEAADGVQNVFLAVNADLNVGGSLVINTRSGNDTVDAINNDIFVGEAMIFRSVNQFSNRFTTSVGGDFNMITLLESQETRLTNTGVLDIGRNMTYLGGGGLDAIRMISGTATVGGFAYFNLGESALNQNADFSSNFSTVQSLIVVAGNSLGNHFKTSSSTVVGGDVTVNFAGSTGANTAVFQGTYNGLNGNFRGGVNSDSIVWGASASDMFFAMISFEGEDDMIVDATTVISGGLLDFGAGTDSLVDNAGLTNVTIINLP